ncbi:ABC transporter ATP-binding protein [Alkaliphilus serpentinus]|uniref:ABC transporter ATP-binding protein n=1 Tax=Alkaliphilus serpentinus TaxID=1482731 RepID=A0A833MA78_9FIRM|nr:ABC transporter ATP-binding protein [Alkaliphilus serpentinus]KAB3530271.1 ABC transporter ATP-binding protein [Alkaliphilus serpentinus]
MNKKDWKGLKDTFQVMLYFLGLTNRVSKIYIPTLLFSSLFKSAAPFINIILPKFIIDELMGQQRTEVFVQLIALIILGNFIFNIINKWFEMRVQVVNEELIYGLDLVISEKIADMDFQNIEDPEILNLRERALFAIYNEGAIWRLVENLAVMVSSTISIIGLTALILTLNGILIFVVLAIVALNSKIFMKVQKLRYEAGQKNIPGNRAFGYFGTLTSDFSLGKDIRLYNIAPVITSKVQNFTSQVVRVNTQHFRTEGKLNGLSAINLQFQLIIVYGYLTYRVFKGTMEIGSFTMYASATNSFCTSISTFVNTFIEVNQLCRYLELFMQFEQIENKSKAGTRAIELSERYVIEFKGVSFKYPRKEEYALKDVSIVINQGEKLSVVGLNGAGKTTFIKLLTRLYEPTEGEILINGININEYKYDEYMKILSVVFQDYKLLAFTIKENIALENADAVSDDEILKILKEAGLEKDLAKLERGIHTPIYKQFDKTGIEFSGGQSQKLAIGRALFKNSPIVVLDEPTAALDPIAEFEIYNKFNDLVGNKTAIYISHRLSSCRFCDKIAVFEKGRIIQYGNHSELMKFPHLTYAQMYNTQSQYYI